MFTIAHNKWTHPDQSSSPSVQSLRATDASGLAHQVTNSSVHRFYTAGGSGEIEFGMFLVGSERVYPSEKLANDHAYDTQSFGSANQTPELFEHRVQMRPSADLESFACQLVELFAQGPARQVAVSPAPDVLQSADEMKMAELNDPSLGCAKPDNSRNLVGDRGSNALSYGSGDGGQCLRPALHVLSAWQEHRIEEDGSILTARLDCHHIQDPIFSTEAEVKSVQDQNQMSSWQAQTARSRCELAQLSPKTAAQSLVGKTIPWSESFQCAPVQKYCFEPLSRCSPRLAAATFVADPPRTLAITALTTSRTEVINFCSATSRFRVPRIHARELHIN